MALASALAAAASSSAAAKKEVAAAKEEVAEAAAEAAAGRGDRLATLIEKKADQGQVAAAARRETRLAKLAKTQAAPRQVAAAFSHHVEDEDANVAWNERAMCEAAEALIKENMTAFSSSFSPLLDLLNKELLGLILQKLALASLVNASETCRALRDSSTLIMSNTKEIHRTILVPKEEALRLVTLALEVLGFSHAEAAAPEPARKRAAITYGAAVTPAAVRVDIKSAASNYKKDEDCIRARIKEKVEDIQAEIEDAINALVEKIEAIAEIEDVINALVEKIEAADSIRARIKQKVEDIQAKEKEAAINALVEKIEEVELASSLMGEGSEKLREKLNRLHVADLKRLGTDEGLFDDFKAVISDDVIEKINRVNNGSSDLDLNQEDLTEGKLLRVIMEIDNPAKLEVLVLANNQLTDLPESIGLLANLQELYLSANQLTVLPESIGLLANLQALCLSGNQLTVLPESIGLLVNLQMLWLHNNRLTTLPKNIGLLVNLQMLWLNNNRLTTLPKNIGLLAKLQVLYLEGKWITQDEQKKICDLLPDCNVEF